MPLNFIEIATSVLSYFPFAFKLLSISATETDQFNKFEWFFKYKFLRIEGLKDENKWIKWYFIRCNDESPTTARQ